MNNFKFRAYYKPHLDKGIVEMFEQVERDNKLYFVSSLNDEVIYDFYIPFIDDDWLVEQLPMKPKVAWKNQEDERVVGYRCLNCNGSLGAKLDDKPMFPNFCRHCGQALDWSDEK